MKKTIILFLIIGLGVSFFSLGEEMPKPTYDNSFMLSMTHSFPDDDASEIIYVKSQLGNGIYAPLLYSKFVSVTMDWKININQIGTGLDSYKRTIDKQISFARQYGVNVHLSLMHGVARKLDIYHPAKIEDLRNAQWYNDNNLYSQEQMNGRSAQQDEAIPSYLRLNQGEWLEGGSEGIERTMASDPVINDYVFGTLSRYARKMRAHLEAKTVAAFAHLKKVQEQNPGIFLVISGPGEAELNFYRINHDQTLQDYFCDYSPFAILEFRDWIKHEGMYATGARYAGEGYSGGGSRYQGASGLTNFNADYSTSFSTWNLKYYNWSLSDPVDTNYTDNNNPDPKIIPSSLYSYNGMMPTSGANYISGGFDPPRVQTARGVSKFYDLWELFRQTMVRNYVKDLARLAVASGFPSNQLYSHQVPGDYLWGAYPDYPYGNNARYHISATPAWTADVDIIGMGVTCYDVHFPQGHARTSLYLLDELVKRSDNWALLEYNPEVIPALFANQITIDSVESIFNEIMLTYNKGAHMLSFYRWNGDPEWQIKGTNRELAVKEFFNSVKDKARRSISTVFTPKKVEGASANFNKGVVTISWSSKIWTDLNHQWSDWGDFKEFVIYRGYSQDFACNSGSEIKRTTSSSYMDTGFAYGTTVYYKVAAINKNSEKGLVTTVSVVVPQGQAKPVLNVSRTRLNFCYLNGGTIPPAQEVRVVNTGTGALNWSINQDVSWITCTPSSGINGATVSVTVDTTGLTNGAYNGMITVSDPVATNSPQSINIYLTIKNASQNQAPQGSFELPQDHSLVRSSIPVTGWVVDDTGIEKVEIFRDPAAGEGNALIRIDEADLVEGARPDIEAAYPDYPGNYKAGWGYMMLTNFLPNQGAFKIYAVATDATGKQTSLGSKTITLDNVNAVNPFGAIDTPSQGGIASGNKFLNWGWALTPKPNSIPIDGSTIHVLVDGVSVGHPKYNNYRPDIAGYFPGYANSNGASGFFILDTTPFDDGVHTIQWTAMDNAGNTDGIGSRFFTIQNSGTNRDNQQYFSRSTAYSHLFHQASDLDGVRVKNTNAADVKIGFPAHNQEKIQVRKDSRGITQVTVPPLGNVVIHLEPGFVSKEQSKNSSITLGYLKHGNLLRPLPIGSTLDSENAIFYWHPGPGFLGRYEFVFLKFNGTVQSKQLVTIAVKPQNQ